MGQRGVFDLVDRFAAHALGATFGVLQEDMARLAPQPRSFALAAGLGGLVARQLVAHRHRIGLLEAAREVGNDAFEGMAAFDLARLATGALGFVDKLDVVFARTVQQHLACLLRQLLEGGFGVKTVVLGHAFEQRVCVVVTSVPTLDRARGQAQAGETDHAVGVEHGDLAQPVARRAGTHRRVEAEQPRLKL